MEQESAGMESVRESSQELIVLYEGQAKDLEICSDEGLELAGTIKLHCKDQQEVIKKAFRPHIQNAHKVWKDLLAAEKEQLEPFDRVKGMVEPKILAYKNEVKKREREEQERRDREERERIALEKKKAEEEKAKEVETLMKAGDYEKAEQVQDAPVLEPVPTYVPPKPKNTIKGTATRTVWKARLINFAQVRDEFKDFNQARADKYAGLMKDKAVHPGIEFYPTEQSTGR